MEMMLQGHIVTLPANQGINHKGIMNVRFQVMQQWGSYTVNMMTVTDCSRTSHNKPKETTTWEIKYHHG